MSTEIGAEASPVAFRSRLVGDIAATLPGATALFRASKIDFCCRGNVALEEAARAKNVDLDALEAALAGLSAQAEVPAPEPTDALIEHIVTRYHETHRRELAELFRLAHKVEAVHASHPDVPRGVADLLEQLNEVLTEHMSKEEQILFPMMLSGGVGWLGQPIAVMRAEHVDHGDQLLRLEQLAHGFAAPDDACRSWRALYAGLAKLVDDLHEHIHLENNVLFPRFAGEPG